jgi:hypothetical protein
LEPDIGVILTKRLKITVNIIRDVILDRYPDLFAAEKGFYRY